MVAGSSFKLGRHAHVEQFKSDGYLMAVIDGKTFQAREENKYTAELMNKSVESILKMMTIIHLLKALDLNIHLMKAH